MAAAEIADAVQHVAVMRTGVRDMPSEVCELIPFYVLCLSPHYNIIL